MSTAPSYYDIALTTAAEGPHVRDALLAAFSDNRPFLTGPNVTIASGDGYVKIRFAGVSDDPTHGATSLEYAIPGAEIVAALAGFSQQHLLTVALLKALLTFSSMREAAGLPPRDRVRIDVMPAGTPLQDTVSPRLSEAAATPFPEFATDIDRD